MSTIGTTVPNWSDFAPAQKGMFPRPPISEAARPFWKP